MWRRPLLPFTSWSVYSCAVTYFEKCIRTTYWTLILRRYCVARPHQKKKLHFGGLSQVEVMMSHVLVMSPVWRWCHNVLVMMSQCLGDDGTSSRELCNLSPLVLLLLTCFPNNHLQEIGPQRSSKGQQVKSVCKANPTVACTLPLWKNSHICFKR